MAETNFRGPVNSMGSLEIQSGTAPTIEPMDGPSQSYQGYGMADPRGAPFNKDGTAPGRATMFLGYASTYAVDTIPQATASNVIVAAQGITATGSLTFVSTAVTNASTPSACIALGVPILAQGTSNITTAPVALDFGFITGTTVTNSSTVNVSDNTKLTLGQWIVIGSVGNAAGTASLITQVLTINTTNFTGITVSPVPATGLCAPIGQGNLFQGALLPPGTQFGPAAASAYYAIPDSLAGFSKVHNPAEQCARGVYLTSASLATHAATADLYIVYGADIWRMPMTELLSVSPGTTAATTVYGKKAFKYIFSVQNTVLATTATVSIGISDVFGFPMRADYYSQVMISAGNTSVGSNVGFLAAVSTTGSPATNTTGDVRGTVQLSAAGGGTAISSVATTNGVVRLTIQQDLGVWNTINATPLNPVPAFGNTQSTT